LFCEKTAILTFFRRRGQPRNGQIEVSGHKKENGDVRRHRREILQSKEEETQKNVTQKEEELRYDEKNFDMVRCTMQVELLI
jgi:hypothetical protein